MKQHGLKGAAPALLQHFSSRRRGPEEALAAANHSAGFDDMTDEIQRQKVGFVDDSVKRERALVV
jgi:hypothetical protein